MYTYYHSDVATGKTQYNKTDNNVNTNLENLTFTLIKVYYIILYIYIKYFHDFKYHCNLLNSHQYYYIYNPMNRQTKIYKT